jgi:hypothetical protein
MGGIMIKFKTMVRRISYVLLMSFIYLTAIPKLANTENLVITTYYPAPYGGYVSLLTTNNTWLARDTGNVGIGTSNPQFKLDVNGSIRATRIGTNGYSPDTGYPTGWGGGVHTWDVYAEGSIATGRGGQIGWEVDYSGYMLFSSEGRIDGLCRLQWKGEGWGSCGNGEVLIGIDWREWKNENTCLGNAYIPIGGNNVTNVCTYGTKSVPVAGLMLCCRIQ